MIQFDEHIFQMGWKHQLDNFPQLKVFENDVLWKQRWGVWFAEVKKRPSKNAKGKLCRFMGLSCQPCVFLKPDLPVVYLSLFLLEKHLELQTTKFCFRCLVKQHVFYVKIWFIIPLKQPFINGCFRFQAYISLRIQTPPDRIGLRVPIPSDKNRNGSG